MCSFAGAWWASKKATELGVLDTRRYWKAAVISFAAYAVFMVAAFIVVPMVAMNALSSSLDSGSVFNNPAGVTPLGNAAPPAAAGVQPPVTPTTIDPTAPEPQGVTNDNSTVMIYGSRPAKNDLAGPTGAVVWTVKARALCFSSQNLACLSQLYSTHGPSYDRDVTMVTAGNASNGPSNWGAANIVITQQDANHFTANFRATNAQPSEADNTILVGSYTWSPRGFWQIDVLVPRT
jgi:hypothetical protein